MAANLTQVAIKARVAIKYVIILTIVGIILRIALFAGLAIYRRANPHKPPPPSVGYGKIERIKFPERAAGLADGVTYKLETASGGLPVFPDRMNVFVMPSSTTTLFSLDDAIDKAERLGYQVSPIQLSETIYRFNNNVVPSSLEMNIITGVFTSSYNLAFDPTPTLSRPPNEADAARRAIDTLNRAKTLPKDITRDKATHEFLDVEGQNLVSTTSLASAKLIKVNLFRNDVVSKTKTGEEITYAAKPPSAVEANVWMILSGEQRIEKWVIASQFYYYPVDYEQLETYPVITAQQAWDSLSSGAAFIANRGTAQGEVAIRQVYMAYYDPDVLSQYFQPIVVFEGDGGFVAYVPAVTAEYYGTETPVPAGN